MNCLGGPTNNRNKNQPRKPIRYQLDIDDDDFVPATRSSANWYFCIPTSVVPLGNRTASKSNTQNINMKILPKPVASSVFAYGTLMSSQVVEMLLGRVPRRVSYARLWGYARHPVKGEVFPGIVVSSQGSVDGCIWKGLTESEIRVLDWFEDVEYKRMEVRVQPTDKLGQMPQPSEATQAYIWAESPTKLDRSCDWSYEDFCINRLDWYLNKTVLPCRKELDMLGY